MMEFIHESDEMITLEELGLFIQEHRKMIPRFEELKAQYISKPPILDMEEKEAWKPDNRLVVNYGKYIVDTFNGYFSGIPVKISHEDEEINENINTFWNRNNMDDVISELSKITSQYGRGYLYVFQNEESETRVIYEDPMGMFVIYDDTVEKRAKYGVRYRTTEEGLEGILVTLDYVMEFYENDEGELIFVDEGKPHYYSDLPMIEFVENEERQSLIEPVETLINAYNKAISEKANDTDYFADAYLAILGAELDEDGTHKIRDNRIINIFGTDDVSKIIVEFLDKPDGDVTQENLLNRLERLVYHTSMVANINDESFGNASGVSLEFKLQPMKNLAAMKERKFVKGLNQLFKIYMSIPNVPNAQMEEWSNIHYRFTRNIPRNIQDEAKTARELEGVVSRETQLSTLSIVDNVKEELNKIEEEKPTYSEATFDLDDDVGDGLDG